MKGGPKDRLKTGWIYGFLFCLHESWSFDHDDDINDDINKGITNTLALPIDKMLYNYLLCPHYEHQKNSFQSKQSKHYTSTKETGSPTVKPILIR
jgi:hypothetical protein